MQDFNSIYSDYHQAYEHGKNDGIEQAKIQPNNDLIQQALIFAKQFGRQLALYEAFLKQYQLSVEKDQTKMISILHSQILKQKILQFRTKINTIQQDYLNSGKMLQNLNYSMQELQYDRKSLKSKFQTILSILGMKYYEFNNVKGDQPSIHKNQNRIQQNDDEDLYDF